MFLPGGGLWWAIVKRSAFCPTATHDHSGQAIEWSHTSTEEMRVPSPMTSPLFQLNFMYYFSNYQIKLNFLLSISAYLADGSAPPSKSLTLVRCIVSAPTRRWQCKHQFTGSLLISLQSVETFYSRSPPFGVLPCWWECPPSGSFWPLENSNASTSLRTSSRLAYVQSKPSAVRVSPARSPCPADGRVPYQNPRHLYVSLLECPPLEDRNASTSLWAPSRLVDGRSKPSAAGISPSRNLKFRGIVNGITPTWKQRKLTITPLPTNHTRYRDQQSEDA